MTLLTADAERREAEALAERLNALSRFIEAAAVEPFGRAMVQLRDGRMGNPLETAGHAARGRFTTLTATQLLALYGRELGE